MPVSRKAHHVQLPTIPVERTMSLTRLGVSVEKVVATIEMPRSHQGMRCPPRKNELKSLPARFETEMPMISETVKKAAMMAQSIVASCIG